MSQGVGEDASIVGFFVLARGLQLRKATSNGVANMKTLWLVWIDDASAYPMMFDSKDKAIECAAKLRAAGWIAWIY